MGTELTTAQVRARRLLVDAALNMTRMKRQMKRACRLVLVQGYRPAEAARIVRLHRQHVYRAIKSVEPKLAEVTAYANKLA